MEGTPSGNSSSIERFKDAAGFLTWLRWYQFQCPNRPFALSVNANDFMVDLVELNRMMRPRDDLGRLFVSLGQNSGSYFMDKEMRRKLFDSLKKGKVNELLTSSGGDDLALPLIRADSTEARERHWREMKEKHRLTGDLIHPVYTADFSTSTYERFVINEPGFCRSRWKTVESLVVVHSNPRQRWARGGMVGIPSL